MTCQQFSKKQCGTTKQTHTVATEKQKTLFRTDEKTLMLLARLLLAQDKAARLALRCSKRTNVKEVHRNLSRLPVENRLNSRILAFSRNVSTDKGPQYFFDRVAYTRDEHNYVAGEKTDLKSTAIYRAIIERTSLPHYIANPITSLHSSPEAQSFRCCT